MSERVYRALQGDLAAGVLVPTERLREERLAEIYGVSRTPVREALARLLADGLIERLPDGLYPYRPRLDELADLYELRILLESHGIHRLRTSEPVGVAAEPNPVATTVAAETVGGPAAKAIGRPAAKTIGRPAAKTVGRPAAKTVGRPAAKTVGRPAAAGPPARTTAPPSEQPAVTEPPKQYATAESAAHPAVADTAAHLTAAERVAGPAVEPEAEPGTAVAATTREQLAAAGGSTTARTTRAEPVRRTPPEPTPSVRAVDTAEEFRARAVHPTTNSGSPPRARGARPRYDAAMIERELEIWQDLRAYPPPPGAELIAADERFHSRLLAASGNAALADALATVHARVRPIRALDIPTPERIAVMTAEHIAIAERLLAGDLDQGLSVLVAHITTSRDHVLARAEHALRLTKLARALRD